jgi:hypothetical protein
MSTITEPDEPGPGAVGNDHPGTSFNSSFNSAKGNAIAREQIMQTYTEGHRRGQYYNNYEAAEQLLPHLTHTQLVSAVAHQVATRTQELRMETKVQHVSVPYLDYVMAEPGEWADEEGILLHNSSSPSNPGRVMGPTRAGLASQQPRRRLFRFIRGGTNGNH